MKYHIDTIPVWEAYEQDGECPLCLLEDNLEKSYIEFFLGGSVMEPDTRIEINKTGFCPRHFSLLYEAQNRLGLGLITHTHLIEVLGQIKNMDAKIKKHATEVLSECGTSLFVRKISRRKIPLADFLKDLTDWLHRQTYTCVICDRIDKTLDRYAYTILYLWKNDKEFRERLLASKGFCLPHFSRVIKIAQETLSLKKQASLMEDILPLQVKALERLERELSWFNQKFDYRNKNRPWGSSKDALPRVIQKLSGRKIEREKRD